MRLVARWRVLHNMAGVGLSIVVTCIVLRLVGERLGRRTWRARRHQQSSREPFRRKLHLMGRTIISTGQIHNFGLMNGILIAPTLIEPTWMAKATGGCGVHNQEFPFPLVTNNNEPNPGGRHIWSENASRDQDPYVGHRLTHAWWNGNSKVERNTTCWEWYTWIAKTSFWLAHCTRQ
jgi:hypothetical protein